MQNVEHAHKLYSLGLAAVSGEKQKAMACNVNIKTIGLGPLESGSDAQESGRPCHRQTVDRLNMYMAPKYGYFVQTRK